MYYFELTETCRSRRGPEIAPGFYYSDVAYGAGTAAMYAERIWLETDESITYVKDRLSWNREVDLKEFAWIKLKAQPLRDLL